MNKKIMDLENQLADLKTQINYTASKTQTNENTNFVHQKIIKDKNKKIVLHGLEEFYGETEADAHDYLIRLFYDVLNINLKGYIEELNRIGRNGHCRLLEIELTNKRMAKNILNQRHFFKNTKFSVTEYLDRDDIKARRELTKIMQAERKKGNHAILKNNKLYINGKEHTKEEVSIRYESQRSTGNKITNSPPITATATNALNHSFRN
jgi:hypothetical protein